MSHEEKVVVINLTHWTKKEQKLKDKRKDVYLLEETLSARWTALGSTCNKGS